MNILFREQNYAIQEKIQKNTYIDNFTVVDSNFNEIQFKDIKGKKVILTVPSVDTKVCSLELGKFIHLLQDYDVLLSSKSTKIKTAIAEIKNNEKIIPSGSIIVVRCDKNKINPVYLKTFLDSTNGKKLLESIQTGTTIISINPSALNEMNISCLPIEKQNLICNAFLTKMDLLKIEKRKIKKLEEELCNIFDSNTEE